MGRSYDQKLLDPQWDKKRKEILKRDNHKCQAPRCRAENRSLHVHHLDYIYGLDPWEYPDDMLITLCFKCHEMERNRTHLERHLSITLKMKGFLMSDLLHLSCLIDTEEKFTASLLKILREHV